MDATFNGTRHRTDAELTTELHRLTQAHAITIEALAEILELDISETESIVSGEDPLSSTDVFALTSHLGISAEDFLLVQEADILFRSTATPETQIDARNLADKHISALRFLNAVAG